MAGASDRPAGSLRSHGVLDEVGPGPGLLDVVVVSPARPLWQGRAKHLVVTGEQSSLGIWPRHADLVASLGAGPLRIHAENGSVLRFAISGGFLKVGGPKVTVLVDRAAAPSEVDAAKVRTELDGIRAALRRPRSDEEFATLLAGREWAAARLRLLERDSG